MWGCTLWWGGIGAGRAAAEHTASLSSCGTPPSLPPNLLPCPPPPPTGARDLEESIGVSLSARRFEVNRLELTLSIGSFSAAIGAMVAGIFGMNMKSMLEHSVTSFWGVSLAILFGCISIFLAILTYTRKRRIL